MSDDKLNLPVKRKAITSVVSRETSIDRMVNDATSILGEQIEKLKLKSRASTFDIKESDQLKIYIKCLVDLSREERETLKAAQDSDLSKLTNEQLLELASSELKKAKPEDPAAK